MKSKNDVADVLSELEATKRDLIHMDSLQIEKVLDSARMMIEQLYREKMDLSMRKLYWKGLFGSSQRNGVSLALSAIVYRYHNITINFEQLTKEEFVEELNKSLAELVEKFELKDELKIPFDLCEKGT